MLVEEWHLNFGVYVSNCGNVCTLIADRYLSNLTHYFFRIRAFYKEFAQVLPLYDILRISLVPGSADEDAHDD